MGLAGVSKQVWLDATLDGDVHPEVVTMNKKAMRTAGASHSTESAVEVVDDADAEVVMDACEDYIFRELPRPKRRS